MLYNFDDLQFKILTIDRFSHKEGSFSVAARPYAALSFRESGTGTFKMGGKILHTMPRDVLFIPANVPYEVDYSTSESIVVNMESCNYTTPEIFKFQSGSGIPLMFELMLNEWYECHSVNRAKASIYGILSKIGEYSDEDTENTTLSKCVRYIDVNFCDPDLDIKRVCEVGFISRSNLYRLFFARFGISPKQYIIKKRLDKALNLLMGEELSVKEISMSCGFSDDKYFSRAFKSKYGHSPSRWRRHAQV